MIILASLLVAFMLALPMLLIIHVFEHDCKLTFFDNIFTDFRTATIGQIFAVLFLVICPMVNVIGAIVLVVYTICTRVLPYTPKQIREKILIYNKRCEEIERMKKEGTYSHER